MNTSFVIADDENGYPCVYPANYKTKEREPKFKSEEEAREAFELFISKKSRVYPEPAPSSWVMCSLLGRKAPPDRVIPVYGRGEKQFIVSDYNKPENVFQDYDGNLHLTHSDRPINVYDESGQARIYSSYSVERLADSGRLFTNQVARNVIHYTTFPTNFRNHTPGHQKGFIKPDGEAIGIEIEVKFTEKGDIPNFITKLLFSKWMNENFPNWICERDGSLEGPNRNEDMGGLEMISPPLAVDQLYKCLEVILPKCVEMGGIGAKASTHRIAYGIHITQNLYGPYSRKDGDRYTWLINSPQLRNFWQTMCRRSGPLFEQFCAFQEISEIEGSMRSQRETHYRSVYPRGDDSAVETRIFKSNLDVNGVKCMIELCVQAMNYCKEPKVNVKDVSAFIAFLRKNSSPILKKYIASLGGWTTLNTVFED